MDIIKEFANDSQNLTKKNNANFNVGDTVRVDINVNEGGKSRIQVFEGVVIAFKGSDAALNFTVRKISYGIGVEKVFPLNSPYVRSLKVIRKGKVRRSKLYYLRKRIGKRAKIKENIS
ncbi:MAG: 50S ribosomal protein L19 [Oscillospiraceae bacterium]|jgi:large subunit ribosomal protein L19|nr:50S ribosomal protein L19 [Oscillospiraceae bacterium]